MLNLVVLGFDFGNRVCRLPDGNFKVGRARENDIIIEDPVVSKVHAELLVYGLELIVRDCGSKNGTFVDGVRVENQQGVQHGHIIRIGTLEMKAEFDDLPSQSSDESLCDYQRLQDCEEKPHFKTFPIILSSCRSDESQAHPERSA